MANNRRGHRGRGGRPHRGGGGDGRPADHRRGHQRDEPVGRQQREPRGGEVITEGAERGIAAGALGGAHPGASESGSLEAREFGTPQADIPGGLKHLVNAPTVPAETLDKPPRPADYHKEHGVEPGDWGQYALPDDTVGPAQEPAVIPPAELAVPVYVTEGPHTEKRIIALVTEGPVTFATGTADPVRLADRDPERRKFWICNETTPSGAGATGPGVRIGDWETCADGRGLLVPAGQMKDLHCEDSLFLTNQSGSPVTCSWGYETAIPATRPDLA